MKEAFDMSSEQTVTIPADRLVDAFFDRKPVVLATKESVDNLKERMTDKFHDLERRLDEHKEDMEHRFEQVDRRFEQVDRRFEQVDRRFEQVDKRFEQVDQRFDRFEQVDQRFDRLESRFDRLTSWLIGGIASLGLLILGGFGTMAFHLMTMSS